MNRFLSRRLAIGARFASTAAAPAVPLQLYGLSGTYATALYTAAQQENSLPAVSTAIQKLQSLLTTDKRTRDILIDPTLTKSDKSEVISIVSKSVEGNNVVKGFLETLASYNRLNIIDEAAADFLQIKAAGDGLVEATVTSAKPLDQATLKKLQSAISASSLVGSNRKLKLSNEVDASIGGGIIVAVGDRTLDLSVSSTLYKYNTLLNTPI